ncbi:MAG: LacI family DNA-binding transcriptional regulator [Faecousia sp.]
MTIDDIAKIAGVSTATVSRVLNNSSSVTPATRDKVQRVIDACGYIPNASARNLSTQSTRDIAVVVSDIENPFFSQALRGITQVANENDYNVLLLNTDEDLRWEHKCLKAVAQQQPQGVIISPVSSRNQETGDALEEFESRGVPVVQMDRFLEGRDFSSVLADNRQGVYKAIQELIQVGHTRIAIIKGSEDNWPVNERWIGFQDAMQEAGLPIRPEYVCTADQKSRLAHLATEKLLSLNEPPTAIFTCNNSMTLGCLGYLTEHNIRIPDDIAVMGFDEIDDLRTIGYPLSVVDRSPVEMGRLAMAMILRRLQNMDGEREVVTVPTRVLLRGSEKRK